MMILRSGTLGTAFPPGPSGSCSAADDVQRHAAPGQLAQVASGAALSVMPSAGPPR